MKRFWKLQTEFRRGRLADGIAVAMFIALLAVLVISVFSGVRTMTVL